MSTRLFGKTDSPCANYGLKKSAVGNVDLKPAVTRAIENETWKGQLYLFDSIIIP